MVGAILTQNTSWLNVEKALTNLRAQKKLSPQTIVKASHAELAILLKPAGYFNVKATRLLNYCHWFLAQGGYRGLNHLSTDELRQAVLSVNGVGPETADDILLYAFGRPVFVIDAYTRRLFSRLGLIGGDEPYEILREFFERKLARVDDKVTVFNEYHALIVCHAKDICRSKAQCKACLLRRRCPEAIN